MVPTSMKTSHYHGKQCPQWRGVKTQTAFRPANVTDNSEYS